MPPFAKRNLIILLGKHSSTCAKREALDCARPDISLAKKILGGLHLKETHLCILPFPLTKNITTTIVQNEWASI